jgi:hypothetical protein
LIKGRLLKRNQRINKRTNRDGLQGWRDTMGSSFGIHFFVL